MLIFNSGLFSPVYLVKIAQLIVQDDSIWLVRLWPGQSDAAWGATHLMHHRDSRRDCSKKKETLETALLLGVLWRIPVCQSYCHPACLQHNCYMLGLLAFLRFGSWLEDFSGTPDCIWPTRGESWLCLLLHCGKWQGRQRSKEQNYLAKHKYPYPLWFKVLLQRICSFCLRLKVGSPASKLHII